MQIKVIEEAEIKLQSNSKQVVIFGAGDLGTKIILPILKNYDCDIVSIWDNDKNKQGKVVEGIKIISYEDLTQVKDFILVVGSNYIYQEMERIESLDCKGILQIKLEENILSSSEDYISKSIDNITKMKKFFNDEQSLSSIDCFLDFLKNKDVKVFQKVATNQNHYLVEEVLAALKPTDVFVDLGAFIGEFPLDLLNFKIPFEKCYCFEISKSNFAKLSSKVQEYQLENKVECVEKSVSNELGVSYFTEDGANSKISDDKTGYKVITTTLDKFFENKKIDYIKSDIEGAEMNALKGAEHILKTNRPILAISIYHSLSDYQNIPIFLNNLLKNYTFLIRHHSVYCAEIVLYCIPNERLNKI